MENPVAEKMVTTTCAKCGNLIDVTGLEAGDGIVCPYCANEFAITRQFGNFLLERQVGSGGMGAVYLGRDITLNRVVAVKVLKPELVSDQKFLATFLREAEITASLNHPNIVQVYAFGQHDGVYYMVVEYISGGSLDDKIAERGQITELEGIEIGIAVARGLECALQRGGLIHRDIKPGNILFNANNTPKVVDFGLSLSFDTTDHFDGEIWGTPYYVAPEKLEREAETFQSDLYSLGATLFHAMSGRPPYEGEDPNSVAMMHLSGSVISLKAFAPDISDQTAYAVSKAMARYPEDRYESYAAFIEQLEDAKRRITDPSFREKQNEEVEILGTPDTAKYKLWLIIGMVVVMVIVAGLLIWKGPSLLHLNQNNAPPAELNDYTPKVTPAPPALPLKPTAPKPNH
jgi:serine/threonine protein kinase